MTEFEKKRLFWLKWAALGSIGTSVLLLVLCAGLLWTGLSARRSLQRAEAVLETMEGISVQLGSVDWEALCRTANTLATQLDEGALEDLLAYLNAVSQAMADIDWENLAANVDSLTTSARESLEQASAGLAGTLEVLESLDIEGLNEAIGDLKAIVEPLAKLLGR